MNRTLRLILVVALMLASVALGAARGQTRVAGEIVLCAGGAVTVQAVDAEGRPVGHVLVCPDMALSLLASVAPAAVQLPERQHTGFRVAYLRDQSAEGFGPRPRQARGPPATPAA